MRSKSLIQIVGVTALMGASYCTGAYMNTAVEANPGIDWNGDGTEDLAVRDRWRHQSILFDRSGNQDYVSPEQMEEIMKVRYPDRNFDYREAK